MPGKVTELREARRWTRLRLCREANVSRPTLIVAEVDPGAVKIETLIKLAKALGVTLAEIAPERAAEHSAALAEVS